MCLIGNKIIVVSIVLALICVFDVMSRINHNTNTSNSETGALSIIEAQMAINIIAEDLNNILNGLRLRHTQNIQQRRQNLQNNINQLQNLQRRHERLRNHISSIPSLHNNLNQSNLEQIGTSITTALSQLQQALSLLGN
uniref:Uncharacterized protein n=1 Tax=Meloidogyne enterolobii TaxID=390850 RepID=A0A6V7VFU7_MELEN|nr:unnamed protein product [Meloidogyne enterolobii]